MKRVRLVRSIELLVATVTLAASCGPSRDGATAAANNPTGAAKAPTVEVVRVVSQRLNITVRLPGELWPHEVVAMYPKVTGFVDWIGVDPGSRGSTGQLTAPFDGVGTERNIRHGARVEPAGAPVVAAPMVRIQPIARLRLAIPVPET